MTDAESDLIISLFEQSARIFRPGPVHWREPDAFQIWARAQRLFQIECGVMSSPADGSDVAGRRAFSRMRLSLQAQGLLFITVLSATTRSICLTVAGLAAAEKLTGKRAPADLRAAIKKMVSAVDDDALDAGRNRIIEMLGQPVPSPENTEP